MDSNKVEDAHSELRRLAEATRGVKFHTEGFEQIVGTGTFYGGLIMHEDGETIVAQQVLEPWASFIAAANPARILALLDEVKAANESVSQYQQSLHELAESHRAPASGASDLHDQIMRLPCKNLECTNYTTGQAYKMGHRDARHDAAELAVYARAKAAPESAHKSAVESAVEDAIVHGTGMVRVSHVPFAEFSAPVSELVAQKDGA